MELWLHEIDAPLPIVKKKYYAVRLDSVLLTMMRFFPQELGDFNVKLLRANIGNSSVPIRNEVARFWNGGLPCTRSVHDEGSTHTELLSFDALDGQHKKLMRCLAFPAEAVDAVEAPSVGGSPVADYKRLRINTMRRQVLGGQHVRAPMDVGLFDEISDGEWPGYRVVPMNPYQVDSDDSDAYDDDYKGADPVAKVRKMCDIPSEPADRRLAGMDGAAQDPAWMEEDNTDADTEADYHAGHTGSHEASPSFSMGMHMAQQSDEDASTMGSQSSSNSNHEMEEICGNLYGFIDDEATEE